MKHKKLLGLTALVAAALLFLPMISVSAADPTSDAPGEATQQDEAVSALAEQRLSVLFADSASYLALKKQEITDLQRSINNSEKLLVGEFLHSYETAYRTGKTSADYSLGYATLNDVISTQTSRLSVSSESIRKELWKRYPALLGKSSEERFLDASAADQLKKLRAAIDAVVTDIKKKINEANTAFKVADLFLAEAYSAVAEFMKVANYSNTQYPDTGIWMAATVYHKFLDAWANIRNNTAGLSAEARSAKDKEFQQAEDAIVLALATARDEVEKAARAGNWTSAKTSATKAVNSVKESITKLNVAADTKDKLTITLWGKDTEIESTFANWILLIVFFGWIWMAFAK